MKKQVMLFAFVLLAPLVSFASSQPLELKARLIADWERAKAYTKEYLEAMPEDGIAFKPVPEIRSFAEQMLHLAQGSIGISSNATGKDRIYANVNLEKRISLKQKKR
jgi:hypothetical protein